MDTAIAQFGLDLHAATRALLNRGAGRYITETTTI